MLGGGAFAQGESRPMRFEVNSVEVNGQALPPSQWKGSVGEGKPPLIFPSVQSLRVDWKEVPGDSAKSLRLRHFLVGADRDWHRMRAHAQVTVRFLDGAGAIVGSEDLNSERESSGWKGSLTGSEFSARSAELTVPTRSKRIQLVVTPSIPELVGVYAIRDVETVVRPKGGAAERTYRYSTEDGVEMDSPLGSPRDWVRSGTRAQLAQVVRLRDGAHALAWVDTDARKFGAWMTRPGAASEVEEGDRIQLRWRECFSLGKGASGQAVYENLPAGHYQLVVAGEDVEGRPIEGGVALVFRIPPPLWERPVFWLGLIALGAGGTWVLVRSLVRRRVQRQMEALEREHALERERARIARDIHDELGANLAQIAFLSGMTRSLVADRPAACERLEEISKRATGTARQLAEIVWAVNPQRDSVEPLVSYISQFAQEHLSLAQIRFRTEIPEELPDLPLPSAARYEAFLAAKELLHNAVRHGRPGVVFLRIRCEPGVLVIEIEDDGCGFEMGAMSESRGLANVRARIEQVGGTLEMDSAPGRGTRARLRIPLTSRRP